MHACGTHRLCALALLRSVLPSSENAAEVALVPESPLPVHGQFSQLSSPKQQPTDSRTPSESTSRYSPRPPTSVLSPCDKGDVSRERGPFGLRSSPRVHARKGSELGLLDPRDPPTAVAWPASLFFSAGSSRLASPSSWIEPVDRCPGDSSLVEAGHETAAASSITSSDENSLSSSFRAGCETPCATYLFLRAVERPYSSISSQSSSRSSPHFLWRGTGYPLVHKGSVCDCSALLIRSFCLHLLEL